MGTVAPMRMNTGIPRIMLTDTKLLTLVQWLSPAYPVGAFTYSHGLETAIAKSWINSPAQLQHWLHDLCVHGSLHSDAIWMSLAYEADDITALNAEARAFCASAERVKEAERQGAAFAKVTQEVWQIELPDMLLPVALGYAARLVELPKEPLVTIYAHSFLSNLVQCAQRLMPLGQTQGQQILANLNRSCTELANMAVSATRDDLNSITLLSDIASMQHETQSPRIFQT